MLSFSDAVGNLFNRLGSVAAMLSQLRSYQLAQKTVMVDTSSGIVAQYNAEADLQAEIGDNYLGILSSAGGGVLSVAQQLSSYTVNRMVYRDNPKLNQTLTTGDTLTSIREVIRQMKVAGATVLAQTVTAAPTGFTGTGL